MYRSEVEETHNQYLLKLLDARPIILDVRTCHEFIGGHVGGAINIPFEDLTFFIDEIRQWNSPVLVCCSHGLRSQKAVKLLHQNGIEAIDAGAWDVLETIRLNQESEPKN